MRRVLFPSRWIAVHSCVVAVSSEVWAHFASPSASSVQSYGARGSRTQVRLNPGGILEKKVEAEQILRESGQPSASARLRRKV